MGGAEKCDKESPLPQIDPKCFQDALRSFFPPIKTDDPRVDFYTMYKREATEYDTDYVKKYDDDLNTTLIFAGLFSAVSSAFVIDVHSNLQPDPNAQSAALLRAILLTLNQSAIPGETPVVLPVQGDPPSGIVIATCLMYASLMISLLAAFVAMLGKQWLNRYLRHSGGSVIERCGDRQRKYNGLEKWGLRFFVESLPVMLQAALLLLACGLSRYMWSINPFVARTLIILTGIGVIFYILIVIAGMSSDACPFQTPISIALRGPWKTVQRRIISFIISLHPKWVVLRTRQMWNQRAQPAPPPRPLMMIPLETVQVQPSEPWLKQRDLDIIRNTNISDARCVSWILRHITDPEALDAAIPLAGEIRWFDDGNDVDLPYDQIVSTFEACFDSTKTLYPGSRDRAYHSGRAMAWIHTLAMCKSEESAKKYPLRGGEYTTLAPDPDFRHLLRANSVAWSTDYFIAQLLRINPNHTPSHSQWISNLLLHYSRANWTKLRYKQTLDWVSKADETKTIIPLGAALNRLLVWCTFLGSPVEEEALKVQDKSDRIELILDQLSKAVISAIKGTDTQQRELIPHMLRDLVRLENRPGRLTGITYEWCSVICENHQNRQELESLLLGCLKIGFRHLDFQRQFIKIKIIHTDYHRGLIDIVFKSPQESEAIADLLHAWTTKSFSHEAYESLGSCAGHLVGLHNPAQFSPRLRRLVIRSVGLIGYKRFEEVGVERFIGLLNHLHVTVKDVDEKADWARLLLATIQSSEGARRLPCSYWELLAELAVSESRHLVVDPIRSLEIITSLTEAKEWSKLECWMGIVWMSLPWQENAIAEEDLGDSVLLLFRQEPEAVQKLKQWMERWGQTPGNDIPESFRKLCKQAQEASQQAAPPISSTDNRAEGSAYTPPPAPSQLSGGT